VVRLKPSSSKTPQAEKKYTFKSGFDVITACNATADALSRAVQDLIKNTVTNPEFENLL